VTGRGEGANVGTEAWGYICTLHFWLLSVYRLKCLTIVLSAFQPLLVASTGTTVTGSDTADGHGGANNCCLRFVHVSLLCKLRRVTVGELSLKGNELETVSKQCMR